MTTAQADGYLISLAGPDGSRDLHKLMHDVWEVLDDKSVFAVDDLDEDWVRERLASGFGVTARTADGELTGMLIVCRYGLGEENLGYDLGCPADLLPYVCNFECAAVLPEHRGHGLQARMFAFAEEHLRGSDIRLMAMTVSPHNAPSLRSAEKAGFKIVLTKEKYGGVLRHVLAKPAAEG